MSLQPSGRIQFALAAGVPGGVFRWGPTEDPPPDLFSPWAAPLAARVDRKSVFAPVRLACQGGIRRTECG
jgi:hypothetical protein